MIQSGSVNFYDALEPLLVPIDDVIPHPGNYNNGDVEGIMDSILTNGMYRAIYADETGNIIAGNHTWMACKELGSEQIPVITVNAEQLTNLRIMVADNEYARKARPDMGQLQGLLEMIQKESGLLGTGFVDNDLEQIKALNDMPLDDADGHRTWPTLCFQLPPHVKRKFYEMTEQAGGDNERFQLMLRLAGWDGKK